MTRNPDVICPICEQRVGTRKPRGGDGSALLVKPHNKRDELSWCSGSLDVVDNPPPTLPRRKKETRGEEGDLIAEAAVVPPHTPSCADHYRERGCTCVQARLLAYCYATPPPPRRRRRRGGKSQ